MSPSRGRLVALVVLLAAGAVLVGVALATGGEDEPDSSLRVAVDPGQVTIFVKARDNTRDAAGGRKSVTLECRDGKDRVLFSVQQGWPFGDTDNGTLDPHAHVGVRGGAESQVRRCRLKETELEGSVPLR